MDSDEMLQTQHGHSEISVSADSANRVPSKDDLEYKLDEASKLVDDIILKKYLYKLSDLEVVPLDDSFKKISNIRLFKITEMVYQKNEYSTYKFASVFSSVQNLNCGVFMLMNSDGEKTEFYMGIRLTDDQRTAKSLKDTLKNALIGQFPGVKTVDLLDPQAEALLAEIPSRNIAAVSCVANNKDMDFKDNNTFIQGLEKLAIAMQGQKYTAVILGKSMPPEHVDALRLAYETIYTQLSPFANMQLSYGSSEALSISDALSHGTTVGQSYSKNTSESTSTGVVDAVTDGTSTAKKKLPGTAVAAALGGAAVAAGPAAPVVAAGLGAAAVVASAISPTVTKSHSESHSVSVNQSHTEGETFGEHKDTSENQTHSEGTTSSQSKNMQLTMQNKTLLNTLERIDLQLKRLDECESLGMWEAAAYFLSDSQETAEMAAGTYKALMKGDKSGVESSAINYWGIRNDKDKMPLIRDYIVNFIHPEFRYKAAQTELTVDASSLLSSNELAIQMGLPRESVCGFPVIEHANFGKEVVAYGGSIKQKKLILGNVFSMGSESETEVALDANSLTMHTFVTGSTGSGKSNTVYEILNQLRTVHRIPFLVIEPAKGEYKNVFGRFADVSVYGTNPKKTELLKINPFSFPSDVHVLEHMDRLVEIFNVCWPMYAAMPAILKEAIERAYISTGWDLISSENSKGMIYPNFSDLLEQIEAVINESKYSSDSKGDYSGALLTRVRSLTTGLNRLIFCNDCISDEALFDKSVIVDLSRVGSTETKSLIMGLLVMKLNEYRMSSGKSNSSLTHITVLEEAHNLLRRTSMEQSSESSNVLGKSVELLSNSIAEMRTYGEGFIIADQSPGLLDMSVIRNTNTKIVLRLPDHSDRELVGYAASLNSDQIEELSKLKRGVAAVYQNDWVEPVLVQVSKCSLDSIAYIGSELYSDGERGMIKEQLINFLIQGRLSEKLLFSVNDIERGLGKLSLSTANSEFVREQIAEYKRNNGRLNLWSNENFRQLSEKITDILGVRARIENCVLSAKDNGDLTQMLKDTVLAISPESSKKKIMILSQCFMRDMCEQEDDEEARHKIYINWFNFMRKGGIR